MCFCGMPIYFFGKNLLLLKVLHCIENIYIKLKIKLRLIKDKRPQIEQRHERKAKIVSSQQK